MTPRPGEFQRPPTRAAPTALNTSNRPSAIRQACQASDGDGDTDTDTDTDVDFDGVALPAERW